MKSLLTILFMLMLAVPIFADDLYFSWTDDSGVEGLSYRLYQTDSSGSYIYKFENPDTNNLIWEGDEKNCTMPLDVPNRNWFVVTSTDGDRESKPSTEIYFGPPILYPPDNLQINTNYPLIDRADWEVIYVTSFEPGIGDPIRAFDGDVSTQWHTKWGGSAHPHAIQIDLGAEYTIDGFTYQSRPKTSSSGSGNGMIKEYKFYTTMDHTVWTDPIVEGEFPDSREPQTIRFQKVVTRFIKLKAFSEMTGGPWTTLAEINVFGMQTVTIEEIQ